MRDKSLKFVKKSNDYEFLYNYLGKLENSTQQKLTMVLTSIKELINRSTDNMYDDLEMFNMSYNTETTFDVDNNTVIHYVHIISNESYITEFIIESNIHGNMSIHNDGRISYIDINNCLDRMIEFLEHSGISRQVNGYIKAISEETGENLYNITIDPQLCEFFEERKIIGGNLISFITPLDNVKDYVDYDKFKQYSDKVLIELNTKVCDLPLISIMSVDEIYSEKLHRNTISTIYVDTTTTLDSTNRDDCLVKFLIELFKRRNAISIKLSECTFEDKVVYEDRISYYFVTSLENVKDYVYYDKYKDTCKFACINAIKYNDGNAELLISPTIENDNGFEDIDWNSVENFKYTLNVIKMEFINSLIELIDKELDQPMEHIVNINIDKCRINHIDIERGMNITIKDYYFDTTLDNVKDYYDLYDTVTGNATIKVSIHEVIYDNGETSNVDYYIGVKPELSDRTDNDYRNITEYYHIKHEYIKEFCENIVKKAESDIIANAQITKPETSTNESLYNDFT